MQERAGGAPAASPSHAELVVPGMVQRRFLPKRIYVATERQEAEDLLFDTPLEDTEDQEIGEVQEIPTREGFGSDLPSGRRVTITFHAYDGGEKGRHRA
ncbi:hypothetical protein KXX05_000407, partial [Aspergillus fumigatus]